MPEVFFAGPEELDGYAYLFGEVCGFHHVVIHEATAEDATDAGEVNGDVVGWDFKRADDHPAAAAGSLNGGPYFEFAVLVGGGGALWLEWGVGNEGIGVGGFDDFGGVLESGVYVACGVQGVS